MHRLSPSLVAAATLAAALLGASPAAAQQPTAQQRQEAREYYSRGQALYRSASYPQAEEAFWQAYRVIPNPVVLIAIAETRESRGDLAGTVEILERYLRERPDAPDRADVEQRIQTMRATPSTLVISSDPPGAPIVLDGTDTGRTTPAEIEVPAGHHTVAASHAGQNDSEEVDAVFGARHEIELDLREPEPVGTEMGDGQPIEEPVVEPEVEEEGGPEGPGVPVWVAAGVAGAALVSGTVLGFLALSEQSDFDEMPRASVADRGERLALFADVMFGVSAAAAITGLVLYLTGVGDSEEESADPTARRVTVTPVVSARGGGIAARMEL